MKILLIISGMLMCFSILPDDFHCLFNLYSLESIFVTDPKHINLRKIATKGEDYLGLCETNYNKATADANWALDWFNSEQCVPATENSRIGLQTFHCNGFRWAYLLEDILYFGRRSLCEIATQLCWTNKAKQEFYLKKAQICKQLLHNPEMQESVL